VLDAVDQQLLDIDGVLQAADVSFSGELSHWVGSAYSMAWRADVGRVFRVGRRRKCLNDRLQDFALGLGR
jgi:hypothetical protein